MVVTISNKKYRVNKETIKRNALAFTATISGLGLFVGVCLSTIFSL